MNIPCLILLTCTTVRPRDGGNPYEPENKNKIREKKKGGKKPKRKRQ
jgi:hypothetical protein